MPSISIEQLIDAYLADNLDLNNPEREQAINSLLSFAEAVNNTSTLSRYFTNIPVEDLLFFINYYGTQGAAELLRHGKCINTKNIPATVREMIPSNSSSGFKIH